MRRERVVQEMVKRFIVEIRLVDGWDGGFVPVLRGRLDVGWDWRWRLAENGSEG